MNNEYTFDNISYGRHFMTNDGCRYIKVKNVAEWLGWSVWYQDDYGNKNKFNAISYAGDPRNIKFDEKVLVFEPELNDSLEFDKLLRAEAQKHLDELVDSLPTPKTCTTWYCNKPAVYEFNGWESGVLKCQSCYDCGGWTGGIKITLDKSKDGVRVVESKASTDVADVNKETKTEVKTEVKKMNTYQKLSEAVVAAITELKSAGSLSRYQVTKLIREKTNHNEWEVTECATQGGGQIKFWISRDAVRTAMDELYKDGELAALGFTGTQDNGTYLEYKFDVNQSVGAPGSLSNPIPLNVANQPVTSVPSNTNYATNQTTGRVQSFLNRRVGRTVTLKQIQSAIKEKGVLCGDILNIVESLGYPVYRTSVTNDCPSTFTVNP